LHRPTHVAAMNVKNKKNVSLSSSSFLKTRSKFLPFVFQLGWKCTLLPTLVWRQIEGNYFKKETRSDSSARPPQIRLKWTTPGTSAASGWRLDRTAPTPNLFSNMSIEGCTIRPSGARSPIRSDGPRSQLCSTLHVRNPV